jgi:hypothetical protein
VRLIPDSPQERGLLGRIFRGSRQAAAQTISWNEVSAAGSEPGHSISIDIKSLNAGKYVLELEIKTADGAVATSKRNLELIERDPPVSDLVTVLQQPVPKELYMPPSPPTVRQRKGGLPPG